MVQGPGSVFGSLGLSAHNIALNPKPLTLLHSGEPAYCWDFQGIWDVALLV